MRAALLISGYLRSFRFNIPEIKAKILQKFDQADVYIHITRNEAVDDRYYNKIHEDADIEYINTVLAPKVILRESNIEKYIDPAKNTLLNTWIKYYKLNKIKQINEQIDGQYDIVIKYRPDLHITSEDIFVDKIDPTTIYVPKETVIDHSKLRNKEDPVTCDIFAYGASEIMDRYFALYTCLDELTEKYGTAPETVLHHYLNLMFRYPSSSDHLTELDIKYTVILSTCNVFAICGDSGSGKTTLNSKLKQFFSNSFSLECDRYHKWERSDENWKTVTHLNPDANFLTKMNKDIFDLKIGKTVYQVDYDHKTGKFTDRQQIEKADNIIVCGLHSLYTNNQDIYNLKIFMDTDETLKTQWKIKRDVLQRGHSIETVLDQIEKRKKDYTAYIHPQRKMADIVINFFTDSKFTLENWANDPIIHLRILISKKHSIFNIQNKLSSLNLDYTFSSEDKMFYEFVFGEYKDCGLCANPAVKYNDFYDYILYFIFNIEQMKGSGS